MRALLSLTLLVSISAVAPCNAETYVEKTVEHGPAQVMDSWMQPKVVRKQEVTGPDGQTRIIEQPLIMERHERVLIPRTETTTTTSIEEQPPLIETTTVGTTEVPVPKTVIKSSNGVRVDAGGALEVGVSEHVVEQIVPQPLKVDRKEKTVQKDFIIERPDPALYSN